MKIIYNNLIPFKPFDAVNVFGFMFVRRDSIINECLINHERIHTAQMKELMYVLFYILYGMEWLIKLPIYGKKAYYNISFEREAYENEANPQYLKKRKMFSWVKETFKSTHQ